MRRLLESMRAAIAGAAALGAAQAIVETIAIAVLYAGYLVPPAAFFNIRGYDAHVKLYTWAANHLPLPEVLAK